MYADPRPLFLVTGIVVLGLGIWVVYVLQKMDEAWPVPPERRVQPKPDDAPRS